MATDGPRYLPIIKARQGELRALREMGIDSTDDDFLPVVELVEAGFESLGVDQFEAEIEKQVRKITAAWPEGRPQIVIDTGAIEVDLTPDLDRHQPASVSDHVTRTILERLRQRGVAALPTIRLSDDDTFREHVAPLTTPGACLRIGAEDLDDTVVPLEQAVDELLEELGLDPDDVHLILDFAAVDDDNSAAMASRLARFVLPTLDRHSWRSFALGSGSFPVNLSEVSAYALEEIPRRDRSVWMQLRNLRLRRDLDYADYAVTHPVLQTGVAFAAPPQLRYTTGDSWVVMKGRRTDRRGHQQFFDLCDKLVRDRPQDVAPPDRSWGDSQIHRAAAQAPLAKPTMGPGNASTWRSIATSHHFGHVLHGLRTRAEP